MTQGEIVAVLVRYVRDTSLPARQLADLPTDRSLSEMGLLDSFGIVELVSFIEDRWSIAIFDSELTTEMFGGIDKMAALISKKLSTAQEERA